MMSPSNIRNIAIAAHVDAGKTTLSERLLYFSHRILEMGEVDQGMSTMDFLEEEQKRGITIESGMASFTWRDTQITLIDTPGHVDFGVEVTQSLQGVEGGLLILSAVRGVETQTVAAWKKMQQQNITPLLFINKMDEEGFSLEELEKQIQTHFNKKVIWMTLPTYKSREEVATRKDLCGVVDVFNEQAFYTIKQDPRNFASGPIPEKDQELFAKARQRLLDGASEYDEALTDQLLLGEEVTKKSKLQGLQRAFVDGKYIPVYCGSAYHNIGIRPLLNGFDWFVPSPSQKHGDLSTWRVLKIQHREQQTAGREKTLKLYWVKAGSHISLPNTDLEGMYRVEAHQLESIDSCHAGEVVALSLSKNIGNLQLGDTFEFKDGCFQKRNLSRSDEQTSTSQNSLLQSRLEIEQESDYALVVQVLQNLLEEDPSVQLSTDRDTGSWIVSTVGEVHLEVFKERLEKRSGKKITLGNPKVRYYEKLKKDIGSTVHSGEWYNGYLGLDMHIAKKDLTSKKSERLLSLLIEPYKTVAQAVLQKIKEEGAWGYGELTNVDVTIQKIQVQKEKGPWILAEDMEPSILQKIPVPLFYKVLYDGIHLAIDKKSVQVYEPLMRFNLEVPHEYCGVVLEDLAEKQAEVGGMEAQNQMTRIYGEVALRNMFGYTTLLRSLTKGHGSFVLEYKKHSANFSYLESAK
jgi:elongation factor G